MEGAKPTAKVIPTAAEDEAGLAVQADESTMWGHLREANVSAAKVILESRARQESKVRSGAG